jgi:hypothetical protein|nr:hypothetical protein [uncultured Capnocytophaga sp.]
MIRLIIDGKEADLLNNDFTWNMQCADFFSFDTRQFSCSDVMYLPMSGTNNDIFELASMVGSVSNRPQRAFDVELLIDGIPIVRHAKGYLMGVQNDTYKFAFHESTKDIYHWLNLYKLSDVIGDKLNHNKTKEEIESRSREYAVKAIGGKPQEFGKGLLYAVAEYGGQTFTDEHVLDKKPIGHTYNFYYAPPAIHVRWIIEEVQRMSGHTFEGSFFDTEMFNTLFISTSQVIEDKAPEGSLIGVNQEGMVEGETLKKLNKRLGESYLTLNSPYKPNRFYIKRDKTYIYQIPSDKRGTWDLVISGRMQGTTDKGYNKAGTQPYIEVYVNDESRPICTSLFGVGEFIKRWEYTRNGWSFSINIKDKFMANDKIFIRLSATARHEDAELSNNHKIVVYDIDFKIEQTSWQTLNLLVSELSMLDLFKELLIMFGLTSIKLSIDDEVQHFYTIDERLNEAPALDWTDKFVRVTNLEFHAPTSSYARHNHFKYKKYDEQDGNQLKADGVLVIDDELLTFKKEREGKFFAGVDYERSRKVQFDNDILYDFYFWEKDLKEKDSGGQKVTEITYKAKNNRFHIFNVIYNDSLFFQSKGVIKGGDFNSNEFDFLPCKAYFGDLQWGKLLENYYSGFNEILNRMRVYTCEMNLNALDIYEFNFFKRIYLMQLGGYFLPNKITFKTNTLAVVELIKIEPI